MSNLKKEIIIRSIKIVHMSLIFPIFFICGFIIGTYIDKFFIKIYGSDDTKKSLYRLSYEIIVQSILASIIFYIFKNILEYLLLSIPIKGAYGYDYKRTATYGLPSLGVFIYMFQYNLQNKLYQFKKLYLNNKDEIS